MLTTTYILIHINLDIHAVDAISGWHQNGVSGEVHILVSEHQQRRQFVVIVVMLLLLTVAAAAGNGGDRNGELMEMAIGMVIGMVMVT